MGPDFAVIIPFYQRRSGVLRRALASVAAQSDVSGVVVIVVDDSSPIPAAVELKSAGLGQIVTVQVIQRPNGGPAAARNSGLAAVPDSVKCVAFLDSDDEWSPDHLHRAQIALLRGFDFYFADHLQLGQTVGAFDRAGRLNVRDHPEIAGTDRLYAYQGDMFDQIMRGNLIGTSTVVFDHKRFPNIRFREELTSAGEDYLCWMDFARQGAKFAFSTRCEATYGIGVNVYSGAAWGTVQHLERVFNEFRYRRMTMQVHSTNEAQRDFLRQQMAFLRDAFALDLLHMARHANLPPVRLVARQLAQDPLLAFAPFKLVAHRLLSRAAR